MVDGRLSRASGRDGGSDWANAAIAKTRAEIAAAHASQRAVLAARLASILVACAQDDEADATLAEARREAARGRDLEAGQFAAEGGDFQQGRTRMRTWVEVFAASGLRREEGRAIIRYAELVAANAARAGDESAPQLLGRAQAVLGAAATWRDRLWIRTGFRNFGRRVIDRVMTEGTVARIEAFERARGALLSALSVSAETN